jgi:hypothetical protein
VVQFVVTDVRVKQVVVSVEDIDVEVMHVVVHVV